jgi:hypothetical protein
LWSASSQAVWALPSGGGTGAFLVSPFNVKWRCYAQAGGVEESKFCLFLVVFPVMCISSISPRFYFRKHTFCFLPLATILESSPVMALLLGGVEGRRQGFVGGCRSHVFGTTSCPTSSCPFPLPGHHHMNFSTHYTVSPMMDTSGTMTQKKSFLP